MAAIWIKAVHRTTSGSVAAALKRTLEYAQNPAKTDGGILVNAYECAAATAVADMLCLENGLSIIENPKLSRGSYADTLGADKPPPMRDKLRDLIYEKLLFGRDFGEFLVSLKSADKGARRTGTDHRQGGRDYTLTALRNTVAPWLR